VHRMVRHWHTGRKQRVVLNRKSCGWLDVISTVDFGFRAGPYAVPRVYQQSGCARRACGNSEKVCERYEFGQVVQHDEDCQELQDCRD
jgi:hypothetical protein